jgi:hypothetical protein
MWYIITFSIALGLIIWWFLSKQYGMSIVIIILLWFFFYLENNSNDLEEVIVNWNWIKVSNSFYPFSSINKFSIIYEWEYPILLRLYVAKNITSFNVDLDINERVLSELRPILLNYLEEDKKWELTFFEKIIRILKI